MSLSVTAHFIKEFPLIPGDAELRANMKRPFSVTIRPFVICPSEKRRDAACREAAKTQG
jgi:hypothetical protein